MSKETQSGMPLQDRLTDAVTRIRELPGSEPWIRQLEEVRARLQRNEKLVAVFGAFSAGKSSLINALLGDNALVVSPNPTTAAVTHVQSADDAPFQIARVTAKTREQLWDDVQLALKHIHQSSTSLDEAVRRIASFRMADFAPHARKYVAFLKAVAEGYQDMSPRLGQEWAIDEASLRRFTAEERFACYIHRVDLAHSAPLLEDGMVLVDTPGVDSIHRRHTDVAFHYMQSADAIVFVLYYTHAFSRADKDFLMQLADVQDVVGLDKLFVVINAVDLAENVQERDAVRERVGRELRQLGIRQPRVHEVSSQLAFAASRLRTHPEDDRISALIRQRLSLAPTEPLPSPDELAAKSGLPEFAETLHAYVTAQAETLAKESVERQLSIVGEEVETAWQRLVEEATADEAARAEWRKAQQLLAADMAQDVGVLSRALDERSSALDAEWSELVFHIGERIRLRYAGLFREAFQPGRFRTGNDKVNLQEAAQELADVLARQVDTEVRTFALRAAAQADKALQRWLGDARAALVQAHAAATAAQWQDSNSITPAARRSQIEWDVFRPFFRHFSSTKQFYEGGGQQQMLLDSESAVMSVIRAEVQSGTEQIRRQLQTQLHEHAAAYRERIHAQLSGLSNMANPGEIPPSWQEAIEWFGSH